MGRVDIAPRRPTLPRWMAGLGLMLLGSACGGLATDGPPRVEPEFGADLVDESIGTMLADLQTVNDDERRFMRYVGVSHLRNPLDPRTGRVDVEPSSGQDSFEARETGRVVRRLAVVKLSNSVSSGRVPYEPRPVGENALFQRIDLRNYGWTLPLTLAGQRYADGWEAIVSQASMAVEWRGTEADRLRQLSRTSVPWLMADDFVAAVAAGDLYYTLLAVPDRLEALQAQLDEAVGEADLSSFRAGMAVSGVSKSPRAVERRGAETGAGGYWQAFDFSDRSRGASIFSSPLSFVPDSTEVIFNLPNGLRGYFIADANGQRVSESPLSVSVMGDPAQRDGVSRNAASCFACHNAGIVPFQDQVRSRLTAPPVVGLAPEQLTGVLAAYPEGAVLARLAREDDARYANALEASAIPDSIPDPISRVFLGFWEDVGIGQAAGELFVTPEVLERELAGQPVALSPLGPLRPLSTSMLERQDFAAAYIEALCALHREGRNRPAACAR